MDGPGKKLWALGLSDSSQNIGIQTQACMAPWCLRSASALKGWKIHVRTHLNPHLHLHLRICRCRHTCVYIYRHMYVCIYIYICICIQYTLSTPNRYRLCSFIPELSTFEYGKTVNEHVQTKLASRFTARKLTWNLNEKGPLKMAIVYGEPFPCAMLVFRSVQPARHKTFAEERHESSWHLPTGMLHGLDSTDSVQSSTIQPPHPQQQAPPPISEDDGRNFGSKRQRVGKEFWCGLWVMLALLAQL